MHVDVTAIIKGPFTLCADAVNTHAYRLTKISYQLATYSQKLALTLTLSIYDPGIPEHTHTDPTNLTRATNESNLQAGDVAG